jgi:membrane protease YdiL (CAAX protease family)
MQKIFWTGLVVGIAMTIVNTLLNGLMNVLFPAMQEAYMNNPVFRPWDDPLMMLFFAYPLVLGFALAWVWDKTKQLFSGSACQKGFHFGLIYFFVLGLPMFLINVSSFNLPIGIIFSWSVMGVVNGIVAGMVLAKINK